VSVALDNKPLEVFWSGGDYRAVFAFGLDEPPGSHTVTVQADNLVSGASINQSYIIKVHATGFPKGSVNVPGTLAPLLDANLNQAETDAMSDIYAGRTHPASFPWPFAMPVPDAVEISGYGDYRIYNGGLLTSRHLGVDLRRAIGDPVVAAAAGRVAAAQAFPIHGNAVIIDHGFGVFSLYAHLSRFKVQPGDLVRQGQLVGLAGATGRAAGPHVHFEIIVDGVSVDPIKWLALAPGFVPPQLQLVANPPGA
jgi:murein DD-endopeptidase MepM/ murein hydrolase activator NlpD